MSRTRKGSHAHVIRKVYNDLNGKIPEEDIIKVVNFFWGAKFGVMKYLKGFKSFSVNRFFFFKVYDNKYPDYLEHQKAVVRKKSLKQARKEKIKRKKARMVKKKEFDRQWKEKKKQEWLEKLERNKQKK